MEEGLTLAAWARFLVPQALVLPFAVRALRRTIRRKAGRLELTEDGIRIFNPEEGTTEAAYADISEYRLDMDATYWLRFRTWDDREFGISRRAYVPTPEAEAKLIRTIGPRLPPEAAQSRGIPPDDPVERHAWEHFGDPPPLAMIPGKRYRYLSPTYLYGAKGDMTGFIPMTASMIPTYLFIDRLPQGALLAAVFALHAFILLFWLAYFWRAFVLQRAGHDRFELTDEGIAVTRGESRWILRNPRPATGIGGVYRSGRPLHCYGRGLGTYYFDPRFLEEDL